MSDTTTRDKPKAGTRSEPLAREQKANDLSWLTEGADGFRDKRLALIVDKEKDLQLVKPDEVAGRTLIAWVRTPNKIEDRTPVELICRIEGTEKEVPLPSGDNYDAVFWTESSIEKFLYPYYHAQRLWDDDMDRLQREFEADKSAVAIAHRAPSKSNKVASLKVGIAKGKQIQWLSIESYLQTRPRKSPGGAPIPT